MSDTVSFKHAPNLHITITKVDDRLYKVRFRKGWFSYKDKMVDVNCMRDAVMFAQNLANTKGYEFL